VATQLTFEKLRPIELQVPHSRPKSVKGFLVEFELGKRMVHELGLSIEGSKVPTT
jgi:hypothetical protein